MSVLPTVTFAIPVLNSARTLDLCLQAIREQDYPQEQIEIILADGGSTDATRAIAARYGVKLLDNPRRTGEAGKAVAVAAAAGEIVALVDSDNLLPDPGWLRRMVEPFADESIAASEPWEYTWRREDPAWTRYCALTGVNDPLCIYLGNYDRWNHARGDWTRVPVRSEDRGGYLKVTLNPDLLPTIGANGFLVRRRLLGELGGYLFDIDLPGELARRGHPHVAKVKTGIVHLYAQRSGDFIRKQRRRVYDYFFHARQGGRSYPWNRFLPGVGKFVLATVLVLPVLGLSVRGFFKRPDPAWWLHLPACWLTLWIYGWAAIRRRLGWKPGEYQRREWNLK